MYAMPIRKFPFSQLIGVAIAILLVALTVPLAMAVQAGLSIGAFGGVAVTHIVNRKTYCPVAHPWEVPDYVLMRSVRINVVALLMAAGIATLAGDLFTAKASLSGAAGSALILLAPRTIFHARILYRRARRAAAYSIPSMQRGAR